MSEYLPPTENLPIFDVTVFRNTNPYSDLYLARIGLATSEAVQTDFSGLVNFNNISTPPHCSATPINGNDLANKSYVDALAPQTSYIVFLNWTQTYTTPTPTIYKKLNPDENYTPTTVAIATTNLTPVLIGGFFNSKAALLFSDTIPPGNWNLVLFANCGSATDQNHLELNYSLIGVTAAGVETVIATSAYSNTINVIAPAIGTYSCQLTLPSTSILAYTDIGIKVYVKSNINANRNGNIFFQYTSSYSSLQTSFGTTQASNILTTNNSWTGINTFTNTTNLNSTVIQSGTLTFPDATTQSTAYKALTAGSFTNTNIVVDANGAISSIASGTTPSTNASTIDIATAITGNPYFLTYSSSIGPTSILQAGGLSYDRTNNFLSTSVTNSTNLRLGTAGQIPYQSGVSTTLFTAVGTSGQVLISNGAGAPTWSTDIGGNSATSTAVALTGDDASGDWFIPYSKTSSATSNVLYIDNTTTPLTYNANFGRMSAAAYTVGDKIQTAGTNSSLIRQTSAVIDYINNATSGFHRFTVNNATPTAVIPLTIGSTSINTVVPLAIVSTSVAGLTIKDSASPNQINFNASAGGGSLNAITVAGDCLISPSGTVENEVLTLTTWSALSTSGIRLSATTLTMGVGGTAAAPTNRIVVNGTAGTLAITAVNTPTVSAPVPLATDSSTNIATTAWAQSAITAGTVTNISGGLAGNLLYQSAPSVTAELANGASGTVLTSGGVGANPSWSANLAGNAGSATLVNLTPAVSGSGEFLTVSQTASGNSALRTNASLLYNHVSNTITGNVTGSAGSSALSDNLTGGVIGNILYQGNSGLTTRMVNGAAGRILTSNGVGAVPTWNNSFSGTSTAATNAVNTGITNDLVSTTNHALTFVANTTGNNPQKTRADLGTGEGLIFIPSSTTLICRIGGAGTVSTATLNLKDNLGDSGDITYTGGTMNIRNNSNGNAIQVQVKDLVGTTFTSVVTTIDSTITNNKLETRAGIVGPTATLTYTSDMIGYTIQKNGTAANFNVVSGTIYNLHASGTNGVTLAAGIWIVTLYVNFQPPAAAATVNFTTTGLSTDGVTPYTYVGGIGAVSVSGTMSIPNTASSRVTGSICLTMVSDGSTYYQLINMTHTFATMSCLASACFFKATRIA